MRRKLGLEILGGTVILLLVIGIRNAWDLVVWMRNRLVPDPFCIGVVLFCLPVAAFAQTRVPNEFQLTRITKNLITAPDYNYGGAEQFRTEQRALWLEVEAEFVSLPEFTDELTCKYFILINGKLLTGEVTHVNIPAGRENHSVMYVPPAALARFNNNRPLAPNSVQNIAVQITQGGTIKSELSLMRAPARWYNSVQGTTGFVLNKNETPFAPLYWERYPQIKSR
jgi:hypothetical protein